MKANMIGRVALSVAAMLPTATMAEAESATALNDATVAAPDAPVLDGKGIRIEFDSEERGFDCLSIKNKLNGRDVLFGDGATDDRRAGLWSLQFWKDGCPTQTCWLTNHTLSRRSVKPSDGRLKFLWEGLSLGDEKGVVDVAAAVELAEDGASAKWRIQVRNRSKTWGLAEVEYPIVRHIVVSNTASALLPSGNMGGRLIERYAGGDYLGYPHGLVPVQTLAFMQDGAGLQFTALDGKAQNKAFSTRGLDMKIWYRCPDEGRPGAANAPDYAIETAAFTGDWWKAAKRYRAWATKQQWTAKGPLSERKDFNRKIGNVGYWVNNGSSQSAKEVTNMMARVQANLPGIPLGLHWVNWHHSPFDVDYPEMFPAKEGVKEASEWLKSNGIFRMPYINGSIWDTNTASFVEAIPSTCKDTNGAFIMYKCGNGNSLARMCPTTELWKKRVAENVQRLRAEFDVDGVYIDQVSCSLPQPCHDTSHGHRLGGGDFWTKGYRDLMAPIRSYGAALTSESAAEPYMDSLDAFLTWFWNTAEDVPLLPAVYSGYAVYFGSNQNRGDSIDSFRALQSRMFLWGYELGWMGPFLAGGGRDEYAEVIRKLCRARLDNLDYFLYGELLGELKPLDELPLVDVEWHWKDVGKFKVPAVANAVWRNVKGEVRCFAVNISGEEQTVRFQVPRQSKPLTVTLQPHSVQSISTISK